jgi:NAD(P)-dependent dehydrogenase (short-subunit alcohol dehydrogenase family)
MRDQTVVVTGVARQSVGEALVRQLFQKGSARVIAIDRARNRDLPQDRRFRQIRLDLNPLNDRAGLGHFAARLQTLMARAAKGLGAPRIDCLVQCAGVYHFGALLQHGPELRGAVLGLNILGTTEVLYGTMALNGSTSQRAEPRLTHILVGSYQGLYPRAGRPLYGPAKAYGIDLCTSLVDGREISRCIYVAPGPIDTPMLHRNHWVAKSGGSQALFEKLLSGNRETYNKIFVHCDERALVKAACRGLDRRELHRTMASYARVRRYVADGSAGILSASACATSIARILCRKDLPSGLYSLGAGRSRDVIVRMADFAKLDRSKTFEEVAVEVNVDS